MPPITEKTTKATPQRSSSKNTFFRKPGEGFFDRSGETFFGPKEHNSFFAPPVQPKLSVNAPDDAYEKEADATADKVMRTTDKTTAAPPPGNKEEERVDRKEDTVKEELQRSHETPSAPPVTGKEEERIDKKEDANAKEELQRMHETPPATGTEDEDVQRKGDGTPDVTPSFEQGLQNTKGSGNPLPDNTRQHMESGIGADFSSVRVHTGSQASQLSNSIQAQAFTHGSDIYFNEGKYSPGTDSGKHLLAHELTHTVQQGASAPAVSRKEEEEAGKDTKKEPVQENNVATDTRVQPAAGTETTTGSPAANTPAAEEKDKKETAGTEKEAPGKVAETGAQSSGTDGNAAADDTGTSTPGTTDTQGQAGTAAPETTEEEQGDKPAAGQQTSAARGDAPAENKPAIEKAPTNPADDAGFQAVLDGVKTTATEKAKHPEAGAKEKEIGLAANGGAGEVDGLAKAKQVNKIGEKQPKPFDKAAFKAALMVKIKEVTPKNLEQADEFKKKNKAGSIKPALTQQVKSSEDKAQGDIKNTTAQQPSAAGIKPKEVKPLKDMPAGKVPQLDGKGAAPKPKTEAEVTQDAKDQSKSLDDAYAQDGVTSDQLQQSKEPEFVAADNKKKESQQNISDSTTTYRKDETAMLSHANAEAGGMVNKGLGGMHGARTGKFAAAMGRQKDGKGKDEAARAKVTADLKQIYAGTKTAVERKLQQLDVTVNTIFDAGAAKSKQLFEDYVDRKMTAYKDKRYSGWLVGTGRWIKDKFMGLPDEVNAFYTEGRELYVKYMDTVLDIIASKVETELTAATRLVADGKKQVNDYIDKQPESLKAIAKQEGKKIMADFSSLEQSIADKQTALIDSLAKKYTEKLEAVDKRITEMKEANKGWVAMAMDMVGSILKTIRDLKNTLLNVLNKAIEIIGAIIMHPIDFLGNLVEAVGNGIKNFAGNIWEHLKNGVFEWLMGNMPGGIEFPKTWDLKGIFYFVMQLLGLTWPAIRARAVKLLGNEKLVKKLEGAFDIFMVIRDEGLPGLWRYIQEQVGNLQTLVIDAIMSMLQTQIVEAGIKWLLGLLTPAGAFIKACMAIIDIVKWFINNAQRILDLINSIFDSISDIVAGNLTAASGKVEQALKKIIPITLGFLASLLGIGDLATRVQDIIKRITAPINKAIDWVMDKAMEFAKKTFGKLTGKGEDKKGKAGEDDDDTKHDPDKQKKINAGITDLRKEEAKYLTGDKISHEEANKVAAAIKGRHAVFSSFKVKDDGKSWDYVYTASPETVVEGHEKEEGGVPETIIQYSGGGHVIANPLTKKRQAGTGTIDMLGWKHASLLNQKQNTWRRGHMISEAFGGKGLVANLSIITQTTNSGMDNGPEQYAKDATAAGKILIYETTWRNYPAKVSTEGNPITNFAEEINVIITDKESGAKKSYPFRDLPQPADSAEGVVIHLNDVGEPTLIKQFGLDTVFAREILDERKKGRFNSFEDVEERMGEYYLKNGYSESSNKFVKFGNQMSVLENAIANNHLKI